MNHIGSPSQLTEPAILVELMASPPGCDPHPFRILIDGAHRLARKLRDRHACWAYFVTEEEQASICTYRVGGKLADAPTVPVPEWASAMRASFGRRL